MGYYYRVCGWLEIDDLKFKEVIATVARMQQERESIAGGQAINYALGWSWNDPPFNWGAYLHYGGQVKSRYLVQFEEFLEELLTHGYECTGFFHAQGEDDVHNITYRVLCDQLIKEAGAPPLII